MKYQITGSGLRSTAVSSGNACSDMEENGKCPLEAGGSKAVIFHTPVHGALSSEHGPPGQSRRGRCCLHLPHGVWWWEIWEQKGAHWGEGHGSVDTSTFLVRGWDHGTSAWSCCYVCGCQELCGWHQTKGLWPSTIKVSSKVV